MNRHERKRATAEHRRMQLQREYAMNQEALNNMFGIGNFRRIADRIFVQPALDRLIERGKK